MEDVKSKIAKVLVIDREPIIGDAIKASLETVGHSVKAVQSEAEAMAALRGPCSAQDKPFDVVFIHRELQPSVCDEIVKAARAIGNSAIILMSSEKSEAVERNKLRLGADEIVYKPLNPLDVRAIVERCLDKSHPLEEVPGSPHILVVDDDEIVLSSVKDVLMDSYDVTGTKSPNEALQILKDKSYEIVLVDLMMDEMHGMDFIHAAQIIRPSILAIVITGYATKDAAVEALRGGAYDFLEKPLTPKIVVQTVGRAWKALRTELENRRLLTELQRINEELKANEQQLKAVAEAEKKRAEELQVEITLRKKVEEERKKVEKEKQHLERQLLQSQKMESLGVMAGGIAHEFNNILTGIIGNAELSINKTVKYSDVYENVKQILKSSWRGAKLVKQILTFSRQCPDEQKTIDIEPIVKETIKLIKTAHTANIIIKCDIKKDLSCVLADPNNIHQVMLNLCTNACHAMEDKGGLLELKLEEVSLNEKQLLTKLNLKPGRYIHLSVADSGYGIDKDMLDKIFDPFFTTKEVGKGTGLGLSIAYGIVEKCGGKIDVYSEKGKGSIFHVYLPTTTQDKKEESIDEKIYKGTEKILVVDDEKDVRNIIKLMLTKSGYKVHSVSSGLEAIEYYKENEDIDLVLVDMKMPGLDGKDTYNALKKIDRNIKALLITGYSSHAFEDLLNIGVKGILQKPFSERALSKTVYEAIKIKASKKL